jgi:hypothetical protein
MRRNLFAYTAPGVNYPEYISINFEDGHLSVTVRNPAKEDGSCGETASVTLPVGESNILADAITFSYRGLI